VLKSYQTQYVPPRPAAAAADATGGAPPPPVVPGGGGRGGRIIPGLGGDGTPEGPEGRSASVVLPPELAGNPCVNVEMEITTTDPEPKRVVNKTIEAWLAANKQRSGVPYVIVTDAEPSSGFTKETIGPDRTTRAGQPAPPVIVGETGRAGGRQPTGRQRPSEVAEAPTDLPPLHTAAEHGSALMGATASEQRAVGEKKAREEAAERMALIAPLPPAPPPAPVGATVTTVRVRFAAVVTPEKTEKKEEGQ
jgi:hypothetical protein